MAAPLRAAPAPRAPHATTAALSVPAAEGAGFGARVSGFLVAEWIHFTLSGIILPTLKLKVYTFGGLMNSATKGSCFGIKI